METFINKNKMKNKKAQYGAAVPVTSPEMRPDVANVKAYRDSAINESYINNQRIANDFYNQQENKKDQRRKFEDTSYEVQAAAMQQRNLNSIRPNIKSNLTGKVDFKKGGPTKKSKK